MLVVKEGMGNGRIGMEEYRRRGRRRGGEVGGESNVCYYVNY